MTPAVSAPSQGAGEPGTARTGGKGRPSENGALGVHGEAAGAVPVVEGQAPAALVLADAGFGAGSDPAVAHPFADRGGGNAEGVGEDLRVDDEACVAAFHLAHLRLLLSWERDRAPLPRATVEGRQWQAGP